MTKFAQTTKLIRFSLVTVFCFLSVIYFTYYTVQGDRGLRNWMRLSNHLPIREGQLEVSREKIRHLKHKLDLIDYNTADRDMIDEQVRRMFVYLEQDELRLIP